jgi:hypothetical protein
MNLGVIGMMGVLRLEPALLKPGKLVRIGRLRSDLEIGLQNWRLKLRQPLAPLESKLRVEAKMNKNEAGRCFEIRKKVGGRDRDRTGAPAFKVSRETLCG